MIWVDKRQKVNEVRQNILNILKQRRYDRVES